MKRYAAGVLGPLVLLSAMGTIQVDGEEGASDLRPVPASKAVSEYQGFFQGEEVNVGKTITWKLHVRGLGPRAKNIMGVVASVEASYFQGSLGDDTTYKKTGSTNDWSRRDIPLVLSELVPGSGHYVFLHSKVIANLVQRKLEEGDVIVVRGWVARRTDYQPDVKDEKVSFRALVLQPEEASYLERVAVPVTVPIDRKVIPAMPVRAKVSPTPTPGS